MQELPNHSPYKVLIVDDSAIVRGLVTRMMNEDDEITVVASVVNGEEALAVMEEGNGIEVVVLDIEMPVMDGLTALPKLLEIDPTVRVIMASTLTKRNADISFQAMTLGAVDYIPKPSSSKDLNVGEGFRAELIDKVKAWAEQRRKMLEVEEAHAVEREAADAAEAEMPTADEASPASDAEPQDAAPEDGAHAEASEAENSAKSSDDHEKGQAPFRAQMSLEHQQMQKAGRIQRKRFTAELRPRPMQQHPRPPQMQMRPMPHAPQAAPAARSADAAPRATSAPVNPRVPGAPRDPGGLIRDAAIAVGDRASKASVAKAATAAKPAASSSSKAAPAPAKAKAPAARPVAPAPKKARARPAARGSAAPAPARARSGGSAFTLLPEKRLNVEAIAIGSSTGGPQALFEVLRGLAGVRQPIFITQHMPATFTTILAEHITRLTGLKCQEGQNGMQIVGGQVYLAPGDYHMTIEGRGASRQIKLNQNPPENFCRPSVDPMLRSIVQSYGGNVLTAILTGMGQDGMLGGREVVGAGGMVVAQDEQSSVVWGMPGAAAHAGICSAVLPVGGIAAYIKKFAGGR
ncbi:chemotaxis protein CheB [Thalassospira lucentensis]|uniref:chemotaxis protein CheB n=1 Tax=Thalassospira lucentensis TaxID=168935 RepID=UPI00142D7FFC|nr:response regulator [Thalassospira lucentensis]